MFAEINYKQDVDMKFSVFLFNITLLTYTPFIFASKIKCPSVSQVKMVKLVKATQNTNDPTCWDFISAPFTDSSGRSWSVEFGTFLDTVRTKEEALVQAQAYFDKAPLERKFPSPDTIHNNITLCEYMPTGRLYWVYAVTPPRW